jgi:hypothetical protein
MSQNIGKRAIPSIFKIRWSSFFAFVLSIFLTNGIMSLLPFKFNYLLFLVEWWVCWFIIGFALIFVYNYNKRVFSKKNGR